MLQDLRYPGRGQTGQRGRLGKFVASHRNEATMQRCASNERPYRVFCVDHRTGDKTGMRIAVCSQCWVRNPRVKICGFAHTHERELRRESFLDSDNVSEKQGDCRSKWWLSGSERGRVALSPLTGTQGLLHASKETWGFLELITPDYSANQTPYRARLAEACALAIGQGSGLPWLAYRSGAQRRQVYAYAYV